jgi:hypothetical protein
MFRYEGTSGLLGGRVDGSSRPAVPAFWRCGRAICSQCQDLQLSDQGGAPRTRSVLGSALSSDWVRPLWLPDTVPPGQTPIALLYESLWQTVASHPLSPMS